jgi:hypothetical protein
LGLITTVEAYCARHLSDCIEIFGDIVKNAAYNYAKRSEQPCAMEIANKIGETVDDLVNKANTILTIMDYMDMARSAYKGLGSLGSKAGPGPKMGVADGAGGAGAGRGANGTNTVIGKKAVLEAPGTLGPGEQSLLSRLPDQGNPKANWKQNAGVLRQEMNLGKPIRDAGVDSGGRLINYPGSFLNAERNLLQSRGWTYDPSTTSWMPPRR